MKTSWQTKKLTELCEVFADGDWIEKKDQSREGIRLIQTGNIGSGYFKDRGEKARYVSEKTFHRLNCTEILPKDCLVSRLPDPVGRACIIPETREKMITAVDCTIIRFKNEVLPQWFVDYSLSHEYQNQINSEVGGATRQRISRANLGQIEIPLPTLAEQKRIVKRLDEVFEKLSKAKENAEKNLQNSKELFESYLQSVFTNPDKDWEEKKIKEIGVTQTGLTPKTANKKYYGNFVPFITPADVDISGDGSVRYDNKGLSEEGLEVGRKIEKDSVLMVCIGATIGKVGFSTQVISCNQQINTLTPFDGYDSKLFYYILSTKSFFNKVIKASSQATLPIINKGKWENLSVSFPKSISEQKAIVKKLEALSIETKKLEKIYEQKLTDLGELKKSVLRQAFHAKL
ncbi:MAG: restriction endonuclease subunit S [bacterium]|nr:restriction endonuclease subunit S [bacterium]